MNWIRSTLIAVIIPFSTALPALTQDFDRLPQVPGIDISQVRYVRSETKPDPQLERAIIRHLGNDLQPNYEVNYLYNRIDLNADGNLDAFVLISSSLFCGTGGCPTLIFQGTGNGYGQVVSEYLSYGKHIITPQTSNGWKNIVSFARCPDDFSRMCYGISRYNGQAYPFNQLLNRATIFGQVVLASDDYHPLPSR